MKGYIKGIIIVTKWIEINVSPKSNVHPLRQVYSLKKRSRKVINSFLAIVVKYED